jgi:hypothetical protein
MRSALFASLFTLAMLIPPGLSRADLDTKIATIPIDALELIVMEAPYCIYCDLFRRDVLPFLRNLRAGKANAGAIY